MKPKDIEVPYGIYSMDRVVDKPFVSGVAVRLHWNEVAYAENLYDFSKLTTVVRAAEAVGQSVTIANLLIREPSWLTPKIPADSWYTGIQGEDIVPWDPTMRQYLFDYMLALSNFEIDGYKVRNHPAIKQINTSIGTMTSIRMKTLPLNYTSDKLFEAVTNTVGEWELNFPGKHLYVGLFGITDGSNTAEKIRDYLTSVYDGSFRTKINFFIEYWTGQTPSVNNKLIYDASKDTSVLMQACGAWKNKDKWTSCNFLPDDTPEKGFKYAMDTFKTTYFEVYVEDLLHEPFESMFIKAADDIKNLAEVLS